MKISHFLGKSHKAKLLLKINFLISLDVTQIHSAIRLQLDGPNIKDINLKIFAYKQYYAFKLEIVSPG